MTNSQPHLDSDRPLEPGADDKLGFAGIATRLAPAILESIKSDGMVIGLEGAWGAGKTTLLNFLEHELKKTKPGSIHIISLAPWLSGDSESLVQSLLEPLAEVLDKVEDAKHANNEEVMKEAKKKGKKIGETLMSYGAKTARTLAPAAKLAGYVLPGSTAVGGALEIGASLLDQLGRAPTTAEAKAEIARKLTDLDVGFVVIIDDLDRLEPAQAVEVVRLVRSVADFPKVTYLMCYDRRILSQALSVGLGISDGDLFLQKIVQLTFALPLPEPFDLRQSFKSEAIDLYKQVHGFEPEGEMLDDLEAAVDHQGSRLRTPREVKLALNSLKFVYPATKEDTYFPDVCRLHLIKITHPQLYYWLEEYLSARSVLVTNDASIDHSSREDLGERLLRLLPSEEFSVSSSIGGLGLFIPGVVRDEKPAERVFARTLSDEIEKSAKHHRLGSPTHYRYYFALTPPKTVMSDTAFAALLGVARKNPDDLAEELVRLAGTRRVSGKAWLEHVFDRLTLTTIDSFDRETAFGVVQALGNCMDAVMHADTRSRPLAASLRSRAEDVASDCIRRLRSLDRQAALDAGSFLANDARALNWVVGTYFKSQIFDHGLVGESSKPKSEWIFTAEELEALLNALRIRVAHQDVKASIPKMPKLSNYLFGWLNLTGDDTVKKWVKSFVETDANFLDLLNGLRSWAMSDKVYYPLNKTTVEAFLDWDATIERLEQLKSTEHKAKAEALLEAIRLSRHF